jgi:hypothetical protein
VKSSFPGTPYLSSIPDPTNHLSLSVQFPDGEVFHDEIAYRPFTQTRRTPVIIMVGSADNAAVATHDFSGNEYLIPVNARDLPVNYHAYGFVDGVVLMHNALRRLNARQQETLQKMAAACRPLLLHNASAAFLTRLRKYAGCEGRFINSVGVDATQPAVEFAVPLRHRGRAEDILSLQSGTRVLSEWKAIAVFLTSYCLLVALLVHGRQPLWSTLAVPLLASLLAVILWRQFEPARHLVLWAETDIGARRIMATVAMQLQGQGRWSGYIALPPGSAVPKHAHTGSRPVRLSQKFGELTPTIALDSYLLSSRFYLLDVDLVLNQDAVDPAGSIPPDVRQLAASRNRPGAESRLFKLKSENLPKFFADSDSSSAWVVLHPLPGADQ